MTYCIISLLQNELAISRIQIVACLDNIYIPKAINIFRQTWNPGAKFQKTTKIQVVSVNNRIIRQWNTQSEKGPNICIRVIKEVLTLFVQLQQWKPDKRRRYPKKLIFPNTEPSAVTCDMCLVMFLLENITNSSSHRIKVYSDPCSSFTGFLPVRRRQQQQQQCNSFFAAASAAC